MKTYQELKRWDTMEVIFSGEFENKKEMVEEAVRQGKNLTGAYLAGANLAGVNLTGVNLTGVNLAGAYLARANLTGAYLAGVNLTGVNLAGAYLTGANLTGAYLARANLTGAYLAGVNLTGAYLAMREHSVMSLLTSIDWGSLPADLILELMRHDAESCGVEAMTVWANGGKCPFYNGIRDYTFVENKTLWQPGVPLYRGEELLIKLSVAKKRNLRW